MRKIIDSIIKSISEFWKKLSVKERRRLIILAAAIIILAIVVATLLGRTTYAVLFSNMDSATAGEVMTELDSLGVPYKTETVGTILIPEDQVSKVKMQLATKGYGTSNGFSYDLFDSGGFGTTDYEQKQNNLHLTEYNVRQQLLTFPKISDCLVKIYLPDTSAFVLTKNDGEEATASVTLKLKSGASLSQSEVDSIAYTVSGGTSVSVENVIISDGTKIYALGGDETTGGGALAYQLELENMFRSQYESQIVNLLSTVFGSNKVKTSVAVTLNFDDEHSQSIILSPPVDGSEEGIVISMEQIREYTRDSVAGGVPGTDTNGIGTVEYPYEDGDGVDYWYAADTFNYEVNQIITEVTKAKATVKSLSIAVLIDSGSVEEDYAEVVSDLVVNALGVNENYISVAFMPFQTDSEFDDEISAQERAARNNRIMEIVTLIIKAAVVVLLALAILSFLRTVLKGVLPQREPELAAADGPGGIGESIDYTADDLQASSAFEDIDLNSKSDTVNQLEKIIDKDSKAIAQLLRNWLTDEE